MLKRIINGQEVFFVESNSDNVVLDCELENQILGQGELYYKLKSEEAPSQVIANSKTSKEQKKTNIVSLKRSSMTNIASSINLDLIKS